MRLTPTALDRVKSDERFFAQSSRGFLLQEPVVGRLSLTPEVIGDGSAHVAGELVKVDPVGGGER